MTGAERAILDGLVDVVGVLDGPRDAARKLVELCDPEVGFWELDDALRSLIGMDGQRPQVIGVEVGLVGEGGEFLGITVVIRPVPETAAGWLDLDLMPVIAASVSLRGGHVLVHLT